jgi:hypothetical protein
MCQAWRIILLKYSLLLYHLGDTTWHSFDLIIFLRESGFIYWQIRRRMGEGLLPSSMVYCPEINSYKSNYTQFLAYDKYRSKRLLSESVLYFRNVIDNLTTKNNLTFNKAKFPIFHRHFSSFYFSIYKKTAFVATLSSNYRREKI